MKRVTILMLALMLVFSFVACKKETSSPVAPLSGQVPDGHPSPGTPAPGEIVVPQERTVVVPDDVKARWKAIVINIEDKESATVAEQEIAMGAEYTIPGSTITVKADEFLPDFVMEGATITTRSADLLNPAAKITVKEGGEELFSSWIYAQHPAIHPFNHARYGITLNTGK